MSEISIVVRSSGASNGGVWVVPRSLPVELGVQLAAIADLSDFATLVNEEGAPVAAVPAAGSKITVKAVNLRRYHRSEGEGDKRVYSPTPSFALEFTV